MLKSIALAALMLLPCLSHAQDVSTSRTSHENFDMDSIRHMPRWFRVAILGGPGVYYGERNFENDNSNLASMNASLMLAVGKRTFSFETGGTFMNVPYALGIKDAFGTHRSLINVQYVGIPLIVKYNYIERPLASFFFKAGAIPVMVMNQSSASVTLKDGLKHDATLSKNDVFAVAGFGGTSEISATTAFIVDFTGFYGTTASDAGSHVSGLSGSVGLSFEI